MKNVKTLKKVYKPETDFGKWPVNYYTLGLEINWNNEMVSALVRRQHTVSYWPAQWWCSSPLSVANLLIKYLIKEEK